MPRSETELSDLDRGLHRELLLGLVRDGFVPSLGELAAALRISTNEIRAHLLTLVDADYLATNKSGTLTCLYPFSLIPTSHVVAINSERRYAMCAVDALGVAGMLGRSVAIEDACVVCDAPVRLSVTPGRIVEASPSAAVVIVRQSGPEPACETCCPFTAFACSPEHGDAYVAQISETSVVSLKDALGQAETIFGDFLGNALPARRRR